MLELTRGISQWAHGLKKSIIFLFNTGEEEGLNGAHSFVTQVWVICWCILKQFSYLLVSCFKVGDLFTDNNTGARIRRNLNYKGLRHKSITEKVMFYHFHIYVIQIKIHKKQNEAQNVLPCLLIIYLRIWFFFWFESDNDETCVFFAFYMFWFSELVVLQFS